MDRGGFESVSVFLEFMICRGMRKLEKWEQIVGEDHIEV